MQDAHLIHTVNILCKEMTRPMNKAMSNVNFTPQSIWSSSFMIMALVSELIQFQS